MLLLLLVLLLSLLVVVVGVVVVVDVAEHQRVAQELAKVNMEEVARGLDHDVVVVSVPDAHDVGDHAVPGAGPGEVLHSAVKLIWSGIVFLKPLEQHFWFK